MKYYFDESGTTGDLISKKFDLFFSKQPIFTHVCIGMDDEDAISSILMEIKIKHNLKKGELKSEDLYFKNPEAILDIVKFIDNQRFPLICEVMDKKYNLSVSIVNHIICPSSRYSTTIFETEYKNILADLITYYAEDFCFRQFYSLCSEPTEDNLFKTFSVFYDFFERRKSLLRDDGKILKIINTNRYEYMHLKKEYGQEECLRWYYPIPDFDTFNNKVAFLPQVHSFYNMLARINKYHLRDLKKVTIYHDTQKEYSKTLQFCCDNIKNSNLENHNSILRADFIIEDNINLQFVDSRLSNAVQLADIVAGFLNRFINGSVYKNLNVLPIYNEIFSILTKLNRLPSPSPLGINFVLPPSIHKKFMPKFGF